MILNSPAKINIGLQVIRRRTDGFHDLQSVMYPIGLNDIIEIREAGPDAKPLTFSQSGIQIREGSGKSQADELSNLNLCEKAHKIFTEQREIPSVEIHLHKQIPVGAGLGGGSSNASMTLKGLNQLTPHPLPQETLHEMAANLGSDCPFFLHNSAMMMEGRGELLSPSSVSLNGLYLALLFPEIHISTPEAYSGVKPVIPELHLEKLVDTPVSEWKGRVSNDFETGIFEKHPLIASLKEELYNAGALYASLSGSGSALYGLFPEKTGLPESITPFVIWEGKA